MSLCYRLPLTFSCRPVRITQYCNTLAVLVSNHNVEILLFKVFSYWQGITKSFDFLVHFICFSQHTFNNDNNQRDEQSNTSNNKPSRACPSALLPQNIILERNNTLDNSTMMDKHTFRAPYHTTTYAPPHSHHL